MIQKSDQNTEEESYFCSDCGREVSADANYCPNCGADIREVVEEDNESAPLQSVVARNTKPQAVSVVDINMPFWSMVKLMVKISLASIPAAIILGILFLVFYAILGALIVGTIGSLQP